MTWSDVVRFSQVGEDGLTRQYAPGEADRQDLARALGLEGLPSLSAEVIVKPWFDGVEATGDWRARVRQTCGVTLEPLESDLSGRFTVRVVTPESRLAPTPDSLADMDPEADDPPDVSEDGTIDLAALVYEHLALEIDPFPRKPGASFEPPAGSDELSPFAVLRQLKTNDD